MKSIHPGMVATSVARYPRRIDLGCGTQSGVPSGTRSKTLRFASASRSNVSRNSSVSWTVHFLREQSTAAYMPSHVIIEPENRDYEGRAPPFRAAPAAGAWPFDGTGTRPPARGFPAYRASRYGSLERGRSSHLCPAGRARGLAVG